MIYDLHSHSYHSFDVENTPENTPLARGKRAYELGLAGLAITDHIDPDFTMPPAISGYRDFDAAAQRDDVLSAKEELAKVGFKLFYGIELAGQFVMGSDLPDVIGRYPGLDIVVGSVHKSHRGFGYCSRSKNRYADLTDAELRRHVDDYMEDMLWTVRYGDFDTFAHCTFPFRYIVGAGRTSAARVEDHYGVYEELFRVLIERGKALEINTAGLFQPIKETSPGLDLIRLYRDLGGELLTIGSDCHTPDKVGAGVRETAELVKSMGFTHTCYFEERKLCFAKI